MVEVFKTNVHTKAQSRQVLRALSQAFPACKLNFDLSDCDKVLRVEGNEMDVLQVILLVNKHGFMCELLE